MEVLDLAEAPPARDADRRSGIRPDVDAERHAEVSGQRLKADRLSGTVGNP